MNGWQTIRQLRSTLAAEAWPDGAAETIFADENVVCTPGMTAEEIAGVLRAGPLALLNVGAGRPDPENPHLLEQEIRLTLGCNVAGDKTGQASLIGGVRSEETIGSSEGRGLLELEEEAFSSIARASDEFGLRIQVAHASAAEAGMVGGRRLTVRDYVLRALCTRARFYHPPQQLVVGTPLVGQIPLTWSLPPSRYDRSAMQVRYLLGSTAPTMSTGTDFPVAVLATSTTITSLAAGTYSVAVFMAYDEQRGSALRYSSAAVGTTRTGIVVT